MPFLSNIKKYLVLGSGKSARFWEIELDGTNTVTRYGKVGGKPRVNTKTFKTELKTLIYFKKQISAKLDKKYVIEEVC